MKYANEVTKECACMPEQMLNLTDTVRDTANIAKDVLILARRIDAHLFGGAVTDQTEGEAKSLCLRDDLQKAKTTLLATAEELSKICTLLGV